jgi:hypothetical protein
MRRSADWVVGLGAGRLEEVGEEGSDFLVLWRVAAVFGLAEDFVAAGRLDVWEFLAEGWFELIGIF